MPGDMTTVRNAIEKSKKDRPQPIAAHLVVKSYNSKVHAHVEFFHELPVSPKRVEKGRLEFRFDLTPEQWVLPIETLRKYYADQMLKRWTPPEPKREELPPGVKKVGLSD